MIYVLIIAYILGGNTSGYIKGKEFSSYSECTQAIAQEVTKNYKKYKKYKQWMIFCDMRYEI